MGKAMHVGNVHETSGRRLICLFCLPSCWRRQLFSQLFKQHTQQDSSTDRQCSCVTRQVMSLNSDKTVAAAGAAAGSMQAPRLAAPHSGGYAAWRPLMEAYLRRVGVAEKDYKEARPNWAVLVAEVARWAAQEEDEAMALAMAPAAVDASSALTEEKALTDEEKAARERLRHARKLVAASVERSERAYFHLLNAMPEELRPLVRSVQQGYAFGLWDFLEKRFQNTEDDNVADLFRRWNDLQQGEEETFDAYKARVDEVRTLLALAKEQPSERQYAYTLLDKLQLRYKQAVLALKASNQLKDAAAISWEGVVSFINTHERSEQRLGANETALGEGAAMGMAARRTYASAIGEAPGSRGTQALQANTAAGHSPRVDEPGNRPPRTLDDVQCFGCAKFGHLERHCPDRGVGPSSRPRRGGMPSQGRGSGRWRPRGGPKPAQEGQNKSALSAVKVSTSNRFQALTPNHGARGVGKRGREASRGEESVKLWTPARGSYAEKVYRSLAREAGLAHAEKEQQAPISKQVPNKPLKVQDKSAMPALAVHKALASDTWGADSMASVHCSGNRKLFKRMQRCTPIQVAVADGRVVVAEHRGDVELKLRPQGKKQSVSILIRDVYFHESFTANLLGMMRLVKEGWVFHADQSGAYLLTPGGNKVQLSVDEDVATLPAPKEARATCPVQRHVYAVRGELVCATAKDLVRLHERLGHVSFKRLLQIVHRGTTLDVGRLAVSKEEAEKAKQRVENCRACAEGKGTRTPFGHGGLDRGSRPFEVLHMDTYEVRVSGQAVEWALVVIDPFSEWKRFTHLQSKAQCPQAMIDIIQLVERQTGLQIKRLHTDGGTEFKGELTRFCRNRGIELHFPPARTPQLNGIAERHVRTSKEGARTLLLHSALPETFWHYAAAHHAHLWNRTRIAERTQRTPFETIYGKPPSAKHMAVFGCDTLVHVPRGQRSTWQPKMEPGIYLGHDWIQNCSLVFLLRTRSVVRTRDVVTSEGAFEHAAALRTGADAVRRILQEIGDGPMVDSNGADDRQSPGDSEAEEERDSQGNESDSAHHGDDEEASDADSSDGEQHRYEVEQLTGKKWIHGRVHYRVKWTGYSSEDSTWEPATELRRSAPRMVREFERRHVVDRTAAAVNSEADSGSATDDEGEARALDPSGGHQEPPSAPQTSESLPNEDEQHAFPAQVHMVMSALGRDLNARNQPHEEMQRRRQMAMAVASGIAMLEACTPQTHREAMASPDAEKWRAAELKEWKSCEDRGTWELVPRSSLPSGARAIRSRVVYKVKHDGHGAITEHKARITPKGFMQRAGIDYAEVFAPTGMYKTLRLGLSLAARFDMEVDQMDVPSAFLHANLEEDVYMEIPDAYREGREGLVCKLKKALYGLKQAPRNWHLDIKGFLTQQMGYAPTVSDPCLFFKRSRGGRLMLLYLFVDDFQSLYFGADAAEWAELKAMLVQQYQVKDLGPSSWILGMAIRRDRAARKIFLDQELYVAKALEKYGLAQCRPLATPESTSSGGHEEPDTSSPQGGRVDRQAFQEIVGTLLYAAISTRLDIAHAVHQLTRQMQDPRPADMKAARRTLRYLAGSAKWCLQFGGRRGGDEHLDQPLEVSAFADADWANDKVDRRSVSGWVVQLAGDPIDWASKKQSIVAQSTCEAELYAEAAAINEVLWLRGMLEELGLSVKTPSILFGDNSSTQTISRQGVKRKRTKHVDVKYHFITECIERGIIDLQWVSTERQQADILTKGLDRAKLELHRGQLMSC